MNKKYICSYPKPLIIGSVLVSILLSLILGLVVVSIFYKYFFLTFLIGTVLLLLLSLSGMEILYLDETLFASYSIFGKRYQCKWEEIEVAEYSEQPVGRSRSGVCDMKVLVLYTKKRHNTPKYNAPFMNKRGGNRALVFGSGDEQAKTIEAYLAQYRADLEIRR